MFDDETGELLFHDDKSPVYVDEHGQIDLTSEQGKYYKAIYSDYMSSPEMEACAQTRSSFSADKAHVYMLGKNLYQYLRGTNCRPFFKAIKGYYGKEEERLIHSADELVFPKAIFGTREGMRYEALIRKMIQPEAHERCSLEEVRGVLDFMREVSLNPGLQALSDQSDALISQIKAFGVSDKDELMHAYIARQSDAVNGCVNAGELQAVHRALHDMHERLRVNQNEIRDIKNDIKRFEQTWGWNMQAKAQKIEGAMCAIPLEERGAISEGSTEKTKAVLDAMAWQPTIDSGEKAGTFLRFREKYKHQVREKPVALEDKKEGYIPKQ